MAEQARPAGPRRVSPEERLRYIGFDVFPGKPGELFANDAERQKYVEAAKRRKSIGQAFREHCALLQDRVTSLERTILTVVCVLIIFSLVLPWYTASNTRIVQPTATATTSGASNEEVLTSAQLFRKTETTSESLSGIGGLIGIGSVGSMMFSSGFILMLTAVLMLVYTLATVVIPILTLRALYVGTGSADQRALVLKKQLRMNWYPFLLFVFALVVSFLGADYGFVPANYFTSLGNSYGPGVFIGSMSYGLLVSLGGFLILAAKGIEI